MALSYEETGMAVAAVAAIALTLIVFTLIFSKDRRCLPFSRLTVSSWRREKSACEKKPDVNSNDAYEQYGELFIGPDQKPVGVALDIMTRLVVGISLPSGAKVGEKDKTENRDSFELAGVLEAGTSSVVSGNSEKLPEIVVTDTQNSGVAEGNDVVDDDFFADPMSFLFGNGKSMAALYQ